MGQNQFSYFDEEKHLSFLLRIFTAPSWHSSLQPGQYTNQKKTKLLSNESRFINETRSFNDSSNS